MVKGMKKFGFISLLVCLLLSLVPTSIFANEIREPLVFDDFEGTTNISATSNASVTIEEELEKGSKVAKMIVSSSGTPAVDTRSIVVTKDVPMDVSSYTYLTFWVKDAGVNSARTSLIDADGRSVGGSWTGNVVAGKWTQLYIPLSEFSELDLTRITGIYIGEWNAGTYYIDDIQFTDILAKDITITPSRTSGTYNDSFDLTLSAGGNQDIYYTIDGTYPTTNSTLYSGAIEVDDTMVVKAVAVENKNISEVYELSYVIDHEDKINRTPVVVQTFESGVGFTEINGTSGAIVSNESHNGTKSLEYTKNASASPEKTNGSMRIDFNHPVNVEGLKYLAFYIKDTQGSNTMRVSLIDSNGDETDFGWRDPSTTKDTWIQYALSLEDFSGIDKTKVVGLRIGQWNAGKYYIDDVYFDNYLYTGVPELTPAVPKASVPSGYAFSNTLDVTMTNDSYADMYYTTDGSIPTVDSTKYTGDITLSTNTVLKVVSYDHDLYSEVVTYEYIKDTMVPSDVISNKVSGKYSEAMEVILSNDDDLDMYYTTDGSLPSKSSNQYNSPIAVNTTTTIKAVTYDGDSKGNIIEFIYTYPTTPTAVTSSVGQTILHTSTKIELISDVDATIYYTTDGSTPNMTSTRYTGPITIGKSTTIKAFAIRDDLTSGITTLAYTIAPIAVEADKPAGTYSGSTIVEFRVPDTDQVEIYYTTDGSVPTIDSNHYTGPLKVTKDTIFNVAATYKGSQDLGVVATHAFIITPIEALVSPVITPSSGTYGQRQLVSMSCETVNSTIYYTTDGSTPSKDSIKFEKDFYVTKDTVIKAIAIKDRNSSVVTENTIRITTDSSAFLKTDDKVMRNNYGAGEIVQLKGTNVGGWLVMEEWQCPTNAPDQKTMLHTLTQRFGENRAWELVNIYQDNWFTEDDFITLKDEGVNVLRLPITYFEMCETNGTLKQTAFDRLDWFIEEAAKHGIYTLIDLHGAFGSQNGKDHSGDITIPDQGDFFGNETNILKTIALWEAIAKRYNGNAWVAGYDLLNEPGGALGTEQFEVYDRLYKAVRAIDQDHIIQIQAIWEPTHLPNPTLYGWENVVYQYHFYGWDDINNLAYQKAFINSKVDYVNEQTNYNVPLLVGEFTFFSNEDSWDYGLTVFDEEGWSYTSWTYKVAGSNSSWGMYTMPKTNSTNVDIDTDSDTIIETKWSTFSFTRNTMVANVLSKHFKGAVVDSEAPVISGTNATLKAKDKVESTDPTVIEILDLFIKDYQDGVITITDEMIETGFDQTKVGEYPVVVTAKDKAGNEASETFTIKVTKDQVGGNEGTDDNNQLTPEGTNNKDNSLIPGTNTGDSTILSVSILMLIGAFIVALKVFKKRNKTSV